MNPNLIPRRGDISPSEPTALPVTRRTARQLTAVQEHGIVRQAEVQVEGAIACLKLRELDFVAYEGMSGQAMLHRWGTLLAGDDLILADDVRFFRDMAKIGKGEVIADLVNEFRSL